MAGLREYHLFIADLEGELRGLERELAEAGAAVSPCRPGCAACCLPFTLLPLEAFAILNACERRGLAARLLAGGERGACAFVAPDRTCAIYPFRPFLCRTRGFPILHLNEDGEWERDSCAKRCFTSRDVAGLHLETWNARLFHLNRTFCAERGISSRRVPMTDLCAVPQLAACPA